MELLQQKNDVNFKTPIVPNAKRESSQKSNDVVVVEVRQSAKKPISEYPQFTSTPCNRIGFPHTPLQKCSPIPLIGDDNVTNSQEGPINKKTPIRQIIPNTPLSPKPVEQSPFVVAENVEVEAENKKEESLPSYIPLCMINSRSRARKQKQSCALNRISQNVDDVPVSEPPKRSTAPIATRHDFTLDSSSMNSSTSNSNQTKELIKNILSAKPNKIAAPLVILDKSPEPIQAPIDLTNNEEFETARNDASSQINVNGSIKKRVFTQSNADQSKQSQRPKRAKAPVNLREPNLNKKLRRD